MTTRATQGRSETGGDCTCKVGMLERKHGLEGMDQELLEYWTADRDERLSLRDLAEYFNKEVLKATLAESGIVPVRREVDTWYRLLTDDDVTSGSRTQIRNQLEDQGVDTGKLTDEFVSYQTINRHLKNCLEGSREEPEESDDEHVRRRVQYLYGFESKLKSIVTDTLEKLDRAGRITLSDFVVRVNINLICSNCGTHYSLPDIVENKGCGCEREE